MTEKDYIRAIRAMLGRLTLRELRLVFAFVHGLIAHRK